MVAIWRQGAKKGGVHNPVSLLHVDDVSELAVAAESDREFNLIKLQFNYHKII